MMPDFLDFEWCGWRRIGCCAGRKNSQLISARKMLG